MAKSNRRRKQDRAKRQARASQKQVAVRRRQELRQFIEVASEQARVLANPDSPVPDVVDVLTDIYDGSPVTTLQVSRMIENGWSLERLTELADAMLAGGDTGDTRETGDTDEPSLTALVFAAHVAQRTADPARARELLDQALAIAEADEDSDLRIRLIGHLGYLGRLAEAITLVETILRDDPNDRYASELYAIALAEMHDRVNRQQPVDRCPCGGGAWVECCGPRERAALSRFTDRSALTP